LIEPDAALRKVSAQEIEKDPHIPLDLGVFIDPRGMANQAV
jgi:hypothetical protein